MNSRNMKKLVMLMLCAFMAVSPIYGTVDSDSSGNPPSRGIVRAAPDKVSCAAQNEFAVQLLKGNFTDGSSVCLAPLSLYCALAMTQNGAQGATLEQMSALLGGDTEAVNGYMSWYSDSISGDTQLRCANSLWATDDTELFRPRAEFLETVSSAYGTDLYTRPFPPADCTATVDEINKWTSDSTDGMISRLIDSIPDDVTMYLINTAAFDACWERPYSSGSVRPGVFFAADGSGQDADFMSSTERTYISDDKASGFLKPYENGRYSFAAILPNEDVTLEQYIGSLTGRRFMDILASAQSVSVTAKMPKFSLEFEQEQSETLKALGMTDAFSDTKADFSAMADCPDGYNIFVNRVLHKTFIAVDEDGTRAGAASAIEMSTRMTSAPGYYVCLDRPFLYAIIDTQTGAPVFMGTVCSVSNK